MTVLTRKQREIREREAKILNTARKMLLELGYLGLNMDRVAEIAGCSKGTVYQHFTSKEDLLAALSTQSKRKRVEFIEKASNFKGRPRERMTALLLGEELLVSQYPEYSRTEELLYIQSIASKASSKHQEVLHEVEEQCLDLVGGIMNDGVECGDLALPPNRNCYDMAFGLWALVLGSRSAPNACETLASMVRSDTIGVIRINQQALLDGWNWRPLTHEWDYDDTRRRAAAEAFGLEPILSQAG
jgi:AcrR family transcriptional regulator